MTHQYPKISAAFLVLAWVGIVPSSKDTITLARKIDAETKLEYKYVFAEFYEIEGAPQLDVKIDASGALALTLAPSSDKNALDTVPSWKEFAVEARLKKEMVHNAKFTLTYKPSVKAGRIAPPVFDLGDYHHPLGGIPGAVFESAESKVTGADRAAFTLFKGFHWFADGARQLEMLFPPLPEKSVAKKDRWDASMPAGHTGDKDVTLFFASVLEGFDEKIATVQQSGKAKATPRAGKSALAFTLDEEKSWWSQAVKIRRTDGLLESREGELHLVFSVAGATPDEKARTVTARLWSKVERVK